MTPDILLLRVQALYARGKQLLILSHAKASYTTKEK